MISVDAQPIDGNLAIDAQNQYGHHADYLDVNAIIQHGRISVDAYEKPAGLQCYIPLFNTISPWWGELALDAGSHVRASVATRQVPDTLVVETLANNIPRFEKHDNLLTLLDEPIGQNLIHYSHQLGNAASGGWWTDTRLTSVTANGMLAPDGNVVADGLVANGIDSSHFIQSPRIAGVGLNDKIAFTCFAKPGNKDWVLIVISFFDVGNVYLNDYGAYYFNINSGVIGTPTEVGDSTIHSYIIEEAANGYYRVGFIISNADANTAKFDIQVYSAHADNDDTFPGDTTTVNTWFWGADLKKQAYFDSYVATSGATATRATESGYPLWTLPLGLFDAEGLASVWMRFGYNQADIVAGEYGIIATANDRRTLIYHNQEVKFYTKDGLNFTSPGIIALVANTWYKLVIKWSSTTLKMRAGVDTGAGIVWGVEVAFDGSYILGASLRLAYGLFGPLWLRDLRLYDRIPSTIEINAMGSP